MKFFLIPPIMYTQLHIAPGGPKNYRKATFKFIISMWGSESTPPCSTSIGSCPPARWLLTWTWTNCQEAQATDLQLIDQQQYSMLNNVSRSPRNNTLAWLVHHNESKVTWSRKFHFYLIAEQLNPARKENNHINTMMFPENILHLFFSILITVASSWEIP